jgi:hypothetical protein
MTRYLTLLTPLIASNNLQVVFGFDMSRWKWTLLIFEMLLFAVILILPQVELPDFTFHSGTAPVVAKTRVSSPPARVVVSNPAKMVFPVAVTETSLDSLTLVPAVHAEERFMLSCALLC